MTEPSYAGDDAFGQVLFTLVTRQPGGNLQQADSEIAIVRFDGALAILCRYLPDREDVLAARLKQIMVWSRQLRLEIAIIGGPADAQNLLRKALPFYTANGISLYHLGDGIEPWRHGKIDRSGHLWKAISSVAAGDAPKADWSALEEKLARDAEIDSVRRDEIHNFAARLHTIRPLATYALLVVIGTVFLLELAWGGVETTPTLVRMGALVPARVLAGELWRVVSSAFLHAGFVHVIMNGYVLYSLGQSLERIIGTKRFLILYVTAALGGNAASLLVHTEGFSVGASGALWGVLGAEAVLAYRPSGILPEGLVASMRRAARTNLVINLLISFSPHVNMAAHLGGGGVGAILMLSGALTKGLPDLTKPDGTHQPPTWIAPFSVLSAMVLTAGLVAGIGLGQPWALGQRPTQARVAHPKAGVSFEVPSTLAFVSSTAEQGAGEIVYGDILADPALVAVLVRPRPARSSTAAADEASVLREIAERPSKDAKPRGPPRETMISGKTAMFASFVYPSGLWIERGIFLSTNAIWQVDALVWPGFDPAYVGVAERVLTSMVPIDAETER